MKFRTAAIHAHQEPDPATGAVITPISQTSTFAQDAPGEHKGYDYSRSGNPTRTALEGVLAQLEGGTDGMCFSSGLGALSTLTLGLLSAGDHIVAGDDAYGGTHRFLNKVISRFGVTATYVDMSDPGNVARAIRPATKLIFLETPTNPLLKLADLEALIAVAKKHDVLTCVDNTFASPYLQTPLALGADIVLHSTTKYIAGHSDVVGGALVAKDAALAEKLRFHQNAVGATPDPFASWLTLRGLKTLGLRMDAHCANARALASYLETHPGVAQVYYPGLKSHPQHELAKRQMRDFGGMISLRLKGGAAQARTFLKSLKYFILAESLGGIESLAELPAVMTHASLDPAVRDALGITDTLVRLSVGIEDVEDLRADLEQALGKAKG